MNSEATPFLVGSTYLLLTLGRKNISITEIFKPDETFNVLTQDRSEGGGDLTSTYILSIYTSS